MTWLGEAVGLAVLVVIISGTAFAGPIQVPGTAGRAEVGGHADGLAVVGTEGGPRQRPGGLAELWLDVRAADWLSGRIELRGRVGGTFEGADTDVYDFAHTFQNSSPSLELSEVYADVYLRNVDLRLGVQRIAWGKLDGAPPTDVINPRDYHEPFVLDFEETTIGIPAAQLSYYPPAVPNLGLSQLRATFVYVPIAVPPRLPLSSERWFPPSINISQIPLSRDIQARAGIDFGRDLDVPVELHTSSCTPPRNIPAGALAFRLSGNWRGSDWDIYHYTGPESGPNAGVRAELLLDLFALNTSPLQASAVLEQEHDEIHMTGADWAATFGRAAIRAEAAFFKNRAYLRQVSDLLSDTLSDLTEDELQEVGSGLASSGRAPIPVGELFPKRDSIEWGIGADYLVRDFLPVLQVNQTIVLDPAPRLIISDPETRLTGAVSKSFLQDRLELDLLAVYALERGSWLAFPQLSYVFSDALRMRLGYLALGGPRGSLIGQYHDNDEVVFRIRYTF